MAVNNFICSAIAVQNLTATNVVRTRQTYSVTIANSDSVNQSLWTVALIKDDDTYVLNPAVGTYSGVVAIQVNGVAYNTSGSIPAYYMVVGADNQEYMDGMQSQSTSRYHLELTQDTTIQFKAFAGYSVSITGNGAYYNYWTITLTKANGTTVSPQMNSTTQNVVSLDVNGTAYRTLTEGSSAWYRVVSGSTLYFDGEAQPSRTSYHLDLTADTEIQMRYQAQGCFSENMLIRMADGTDKRIGDVKAGDEVLAWNCEWDKDNEELVAAKVEFSSSGLTRVAPKYDRYTFSNGTVIEIIDRDRLYNIEDNKMKWMDQWHIGEHGLTLDGEEVALVSHEVVNEDIVFHDFTSEYYNYFVNGILSGKKAARYPFLPSRHKPNN